MIHNGLVSLESSACMLYCPCYYCQKRKDDVEAYVRSCLVSQLDKLERKNETGLLQPLPILERPFQSVSMDFISRFPKVDGKTSIFVVVDTFSKYEIFIACLNACPTDIAANLCFKYVVKYFGIQEALISDCDNDLPGGSGLRFLT